MLDEDIARGQSALEEVLKSNHHLDFQGMFDDSLFLCGQHYRLDREEGLYMTESTSPNRQVICVPSRISFGGAIQGAKWLRPWMFKHGFACGSSYTCPLTLNHGTVYLRIDDAAQKIHVEWLSEELFNWLIKSDMVGLVNYIGLRLAPRSIVEDVTLLDWMTPELVYLNWGIMVPRNLLYWWDLHRKYPDGFMTGAAGPIHWMAESISKTEFIEKCINAGLEDHL